MSFNLIVLFSFCFSLNGNVVNVCVCCFSHSWNSLVGIKSWCQSSRSHCPNTRRIAISGIHFTFTSTYYVCICEPSVNYCMSFSLWNEAHTGALRVFIRSSHMAKFRNIIFRFSGVLSLMHFPIFFSVRFLDELSPNLFIQMHVYDCTELCCRRPREIIRSKEKSVFYRIIFHLCYFSLFVSSRKYKQK